MDANAIVKEFDWQTKAQKVKEIIMLITTPVVFVWNKARSAYIQLVHSAAQFGGTHLTPRSTNQSS